MRKLLVTLLLSTLFSTSALAADMKIAVVNVQRILAEAPQVEAVNATMLERFGPQRDELQAMEKDIKKIEEEYKRNELVMTEDKLNELKQKAIKKLQAYKQKEATIAQEVNTVRNQELAVLQKQVNGIIVDIAEDGDYDLVLSEGVAYYDEDLDITDKILDKMKADFKK